jgi:hypothetical protein
VEVHHVRHERQVGEQRVVPADVPLRHQHRPDLWAVPAGDDTAAGRDREQLRAEADRQGRQVPGHRLREEPADIGEPRVVEVVVRAHVPAEAHQTGVAARVGREVGGGADVQLGAGSGEPVAEGSERILLVGLDDEQTWRYHTVEGSRTNSSSVESYTGR